MTPSGAAGRPLPLPVLTRRAMLAVLGAGGASLLSACYGFSGGGGLPKNIKTVAIQPFDNQTAAPELQREIFEELRKVMRERLNLREAPESRADIIVSGTIVNYEVDLPLGASADQRQTTSNRRRLQVTVDVEITEVATTRRLLNLKGKMREGQYAEGGETTGRRNALESLMTDIVEGVQSQW